MKQKTALLISFLGVSIALHAANEKIIPNPQIDYSGFLADASKVGDLREKKRLTEEAFARMSSERDTIIFDARSDEKYRMLHIKTAKNLSLPDITEAELKKVIPSKTTRVLIYCNNNFENEEKAFPVKAMRASLNIYTFNTLYSYGYINVYELGPLIDIKNSKLEFEGGMAKQPAL
jgi:hypothetical protein